MNALQVGTVQELTVLRNIETGYVLTDGKNEVLLHKNEASEELEEKQEVNVFIYHDKKGQVVATMTIPDVNLENYDWAEVVEVLKGVGVFVNIGIQKEILVSNDDLPLYEGVWPQVGDLLFVILDKDKKGRLLAKPVTEGIVEDDFETAPETMMNQPISGRTIRSSKEGAVILSEEGYRGFIHHSETNAEPRVGEWVKGRVIKVKSDGTLNVSLLPLKQEALGDDAELIINFLLEHDGVMPLGDKSSPDEIKNTFNISKAAFKRALGKLMKEKKVAQEDGKTMLISE